MDIFGKKLVDAKAYNEYQKQLSVVEKAYTENIIRPNLDTLWLNSDVGAKVPVYPFPLPVIYDMSWSVDALRIPLETLRREIFRNGLELKERWKFKCSNCKKEFQSMPTNDKEELECDSCHNKKLVRPDPQHRLKLFSVLTKPMNNNGQTLEDILFEVERDLDVADIGFILLLKTYDIDNSTMNVVGEELDELLRGSPTQIHLIADRKGRLGYDDNQKKVYVCPNHREKRQYQDRCQECRTQCLEAIAESNNMFAASPASDEKITIYGKGEVIWKSKYQPSLLYGYSPIYAVWMKVLTLYHMDTYMLKYYDKMRPPRGLLVVSSRNFESMKKAWDSVREKAKEDPYMIYPLMVETDKSGKAVAQWVNFMDSLEDLQFIDVRNEYRRTIGASYGVLPLFSGDLPSGWSNEGMQVTVTNRAVEYGQRVLFNGFLQPLARMMGVDDWILQMKSSEIIDELRDLQVEQQKIQNAVAMHGMGFEVEFTHTGEFKFSKKPTLQTEGNGDTGMNANKPFVREDMQTQFEGQPLAGRPSEQGGMAEGHPASGRGTSLSQKTDDGWFDEIEKNMLNIDGLDETIRKAAINDVREEAVSSAWIGNYDELDSTFSSIARSYIQQGFATNSTKSSVINKLTRILGMPQDQAERVVKTEYNYMLNRARELAFKSQDKEGTFRYSWETGLSPCEACLEIAVKTANGVPLERLKEIIREISLKHGHKANRALLVHPMDKCYIKKVKEVKSKQYKIKRVNKGEIEVDVNE